MDEKAGTFDHANTIMVRSRPSSSGLSSCDFVLICKITFRMESHCFDTVDEILLNANYPYIVTTQHIPNII